jgi:hypothetical protein
MGGKKDINLDLRSKPDLITKSIGKFPVICWSLTFGALIITCLAIPVVRTFLNSTFSLNLKLEWSKLLYHIDFYILAVIFLISGLGLYLNSIRNRRRTDQYNPSLIYFLVLSAVCIAGYLIFFESIL